MFVCVSFLSMLNAGDNKMMSENIMAKTVYIFYRLSPEGPLFDSQNLLLD